MPSLRAARNKQPKRRTTHGSSSKKEQDYNPFFPPSGLAQSLLLVLSLVMAALFCSESMNSITLAPIFKMFINLPLAMIAFLDSKHVEELLGKSFSFSNPMQSPQSFHPLARGFVLLSGAFFLHGLGDSHIAQQPLFSPIFVRLPFHLLGFLLLTGSSIDQLKALLDGKQTKPLAKLIFWSCLPFVLVGLGISGVNAFVHSQWSLQGKLIVLGAGLVLPLGVGVARLEEHWSMVLGYGLHALNYQLLVIAADLEWEWLFSWTWLSYCVAQYSLFFGCLYAISQNFNRFIYVVDGNNPLADMFNFTDQRLTSPDLSEDFPDEKSSS